MAIGKAIIMQATDNVATVVEDIPPLTEIELQTDGRTVVVHVTEGIRFGHKFALRDIRLGDPVVKYGEPIGLATQNIQTGQHVHVHNLESVRGRGDK